MRGARFRLGLRTVRTRRPGRRAAHGSQLGPATPSLRPRSVLASLPCLHPHRTRRGRRDRGVLPTARGDAGRTPGCAQRSQTGATRLSRKPGRSGRAARPEVLQGALASQASRLAPARGPQPPPPPRRRESGRGRLSTSQEPPRKGEAPSPPPTRDDRAPLTCWPRRPRAAPLGAARCSSAPSRRLGFPEKFGALSPTLARDRKRPVAQSRGSSRSTQPSSNHLRRLRGGGPLGTPGKVCWGARAAHAGVCPGWRCGPPRGEKCLAVPAPRAWRTWGRVSALGAAWRGGGDGAGGVDAAGGGRAWGAAAAGARPVPAPPAALPGAHQGGHQVGAERTGPGGGWRAARRLDSRRPSSYTDACYVGVECVRPNPRV